MKDKRLQIFVSSTYVDLIEERQAAVEAILSTGHIPAGMELFAAGDESQMTVIERWIDESDIYLLILGGRYGSVESKTGKSYTQLEYEYALTKGKPLFAVVVKQNALDEKIKSMGRNAIEQENPKLLKEFKELVLKNLVRFWEDKKDIKIAVHETLSEFSTRKDLIGWIRGDNNINTGALAEEIARLTKENSELRNKLIVNDNNNSNILYANLTYKELEKLLKNETVENDIYSNLFEFLMATGDDLSATHGVNPSNINPFEKLSKYKLVVDVGTVTYQYKFTEDGHNFFLKTLSYSQE